jgi:hypothetical protein
VSVKVVHHQTYFGRIGVAFVEHAFNEVGSILARAPLGHFNVAAASQRFDFHKERGHSVAYVFVIDKLSVTRCYRNRLVDFPDQLFARFVHAHDRKTRIMGKLIDRQHIFHCGDKSGVPVGRDLPVAAQVRLQFVFFRDRWTVMAETESAIFSSTSLSAKSRIVQRW